MNRNPMHCLVCDKVLPPVMEEDPECLQPSGGLMCTAHGNYGSTVFDPIGLEERGSYLLFFVCDDCVTKKEQQIYRMQAER